MNWVDKHKEKRRKVNEQEFRTIEENTYKELTENKQAFIVKHIKKQAQLESSRLTFSLIMVALIGLFIQISVILGLNIFAAETMAIVIAFSMAVLIGVFIIGGFMIYCHRVKREYLDIEAYILKREINSTDIL